MSFALDVGGNCLASCQFHSGDLSLGRVGFLWFGREYLRADAFLLVATVEGRRFGKFDFLFGFLAHGLVECH